MLVDKKIFTIFAPKLENRDINKKRKDKNYVLDTGISFKA